jgi:hypothetical protein
MVSSEWRSCVFNSVAPDASEDDEEKNEICQLSTTCQVITRYMYQGHAQEKNIQFKYCGETHIVGKLNHQFRLRVFASWLEDAPEECTL